MSIVAAMLFIIQSSGTRSGMVEVGAGTAHRSSGAGQTILATRREWMWGCRGDEAQPRSVQGGLAALPDDSGSCERHPCMPGSGETAQWPRRPS